MSKTGFIYALKDPRTNAICYVGQTIYQLNKRLIEHYSAPHNVALRAWVEELGALELKPLIELLEEVPRDRLNIYEDYWMGETAYQGAYLLNGRLGRSATAAYLGGDRPERPN